MTLSQIYNLDSGLDAREKINTSFEVVDILWSLTASNSTGSTSSVYSVNGMTGSIVLTTDEILEGTNEYFTESKVLSSILTGFTNSSGTVSSTDSILEAIQKINGNIPNVNITSNVIPKGSGTGILDGTWQFSGNNILPVTTGSNIGSTVSRIGTIFISNNTPNIDYSGDLTFNNGTSTRMTLNGNGDLGLGLNAFPYRFAAISNDNADFSAMKLLSANQLQFLELGWAGLNSTYYLKLTSGSSQDIILAPSKTVQINGNDSTSSNYSLKIDNSSTQTIASFRNDRFVGIGTSVEVIGNTGHKFEFHGVSNNGLGTDAFYNAAFSTSNSFAVDMGAGIAFGGKYNTAGLINPFSGINGVKLNSTDGNFEGRLNLWVRNGSTSVVSFTSTPYGSKVRNGMGIKNPTALLHLDGDNADVFISQARCLNTTGYAGKFYANVANSSDNIGIYSEVANGANNYAAILMGGNVGIGTSSPLSTLHSEYNINDTVAVIRASNTNTGVSAGVSFNAYNGTNAVEFGILSTTHTTFSASYGTANDVYLRSSSGAGRINIINAAGNPILFGSSVSVPAAMISPASGNFAIGTSTPTTSTRLHVYRAVNDFLYELKVENPTNGVSAASSILIQSDSGKLEFGQLSTLFTTYTVYGQTGDTFIRSGTGSRNLNILTDPGNTGKILFFSRLNPTVDATLPSLAIDGTNVSIGTNIPLAKLHVFSNTGVVGADLFKVNNAFVNFRVNDSGFATLTGNNGLQVIGSNGILDIVSNGGISPSLRFFYNNFASHQATLHGENNSMVMELEASSLGFAIGYVGSSFTPGATLHARGINSNSTGYAFKADNSSSSTILHLRNNQEIIFGGSAGIYIDNNQIIYAKNSVGTYEQVFIGRSSTDNITSLSYGSGGFILRDKDLNSSVWVTDDNKFGFGYAYGETTYMTSKYNFKVSTADADGIRFQNTGATDGVGAFVIASGGSSGFGISGWANSGIIENGNSSGSLVLGSYLSGIKFQTGGRVTNMSLTSTGSLGLGTETPVASALFEMTSTTKGFLPSRMTATQAEAISSPAEGLLVYATDGTGVTITTKGWWGYDGATWVKLN